MIDTQKIAFIGAALGWGAQKIQTELGPELIKAHSNKLSYWQSIVYPPPSDSPPPIHYSQALELITKTDVDLAKETDGAIRERYFPIVVGGDHSMAIGTWSGIISALGAPKEFGLIWFDAHMDAHTPQSSPSKAIHGMPVAVLLGKGDPDLVNLYERGAKISPKHLVLMGVRSFEPEEAALLDSLGVKIFFAQEILERGFEPVYQEALEIVTQHTKGFGVSIDLDGFDPRYAPGVGSPVANGLVPEAILPGLSKLINHPHCKALEIAEFNPTLDKDNKTLHLIETLIRQKQS